MDSLEIEMQPDGTGRITNSPDRALTNAEMSDFNREWTRLARTIASDELMRLGLTPGSEQFERALDRIRSPNDLRELSEMADEQVVNKLRMFE